MKEEIKVLRCTCDICGRTEDVIGHKPNPLVRLVLPVDYCDEYGSYKYISTDEVDVCKGCLEDISKVLSEYYSIKLIMYGGLQIKKKGGEG